MVEIGLARTIDGRIDRTASLIADMLTVEGLVFSMSKSWCFVRRCDLSMVSQYTHAMLFDVRGSTTPEFLSRSMTS